MGTCIECGSPGPDSAGWCDSCGHRAMLVSIAAAVFSVDRLGADPSVPLSVGRSPAGAETVVGQIRLAVDGADLTATALDPSRVVDVEWPDGGRAALAPAQPIRLVEGARLHIGEHSLLLAGSAEAEAVRPGDSPRPIPDARGVPSTMRDRMVEQLSLDAEEAMEALHGGPDGHDFSPVVRDVLGVAQRSLAEDRYRLPEAYWPRLVPGLIIEGSGTDFVGADRTVWLRKSQATTPVALVDLGEAVAVSVGTGDGAGSAILAISGIGLVAAVRCRRLTSSRPGVEFRYVDPSATSGNDMSLDRMVIAVPHAGKTLVESWHARLLTIFAADSR